jgi:coenzyme F420-reducing hydrogenase beta subunit
MIDIINKTDCCGCTACASICPKDAIVMEPDFEGFLYPKVLADKCVDCGLCEKACPVMHKPEKKDQFLSSVVLRIKREDVLQGSTSGGFTTPLVEWVLEQGGAVCAATYDKDFRVVHAIIDTMDPEQIARTRGSKYVQSRMGDCFLQIKDLLKSDRLVCFVGTTCQVAGLKAFLGKDYPNLICVDLVCHGTPSPKLWEKYLTYQKEKVGSDITQIAFRNKTYGYHSGTMKICFSNGKTYYGSARVDPMLKSFFREIASRPICYQCPFKTLERCSDFTIYDCWHAGELVAGLKDDDKGYTNVIVQSEKGQKVLDQIKESYEIYPVDTEKVVAMDGSMVRGSAVPHKRRAEYYVDLDRHSLPEHIQAFIPVSSKDRVIEKCKHSIYRMGIYTALKKAKDKLGK